MQDQSVHRLRQYIVNENSASCQTVHCSVEQLSTKHFISKIEKFTATNYLKFRTYYPDVHGLQEGMEEWMNRWMYGWTDE